MEKFDKIVVTHEAALRKKHGPAGLKRIEKAIARLARADAARGLRSKMLFLDRAADMESMGATVKRASDRRQVKRAIDDVFRVAEPEYLMVLGAPDVVPHQRLNNPVSVADDPDRFVESDLPYACDAPYNTAIRKFLGPTRVLGRLPDVAEKGDTAWRSADTWKEIGSK